jgi:hypothetical protein
MAELSAADFAWDNHFWTTTVTLPVWRGFQSRRAPYGAEDSTEPSDGSVELVFAPEGRDESPLRESEVALVRWAVAHAPEMQSSLLEGLLKVYPALRKRYASYVEPEDMPPVRAVEELRTLIGLHSVNVHPLEKDGLPYVGFEFGCTWDDEHGLGVLMHGTRVVEISGADTAILLWIAEKDAGVES